MNGNKTAHLPRRDRALVTAAEWFAGRRRVCYDPESARVLAEVLTFPGGHLTTSEHPDLLAAAIRGIAARHGVGNPATTHQ